MGFRLEDISLEGKSFKQEIRGEYDFGLKGALSDDRTFCFSNCFTDYDQDPCYTNCPCEDDDCGPYDP